VGGSPFTIRWVPGYWPPTPIFATEAVSDNGPHSLNFKCLVR